MAQDWFCVAGNYSVKIHSLIGGTVAECLRVFASREYLTINMEADDFARIESVENYGPVKDVIF